MLEIAKKDLKLYFYSPVGYVCIAVLWAFFGYLFYQLLLTGSTSFVPTVYRTMFTWCMMIIPILTMRTISEERKNKTDQILLTTPVGVGAIVGGKFLAAMCVYTIILLGTLLPCMVLEYLGNPAWGMILGNIAASLLYGAAMIAIGIFISSFTLNQISAAVGTLAAAIFLMIIDSLSASAGSRVISTLVRWISFNARYEPFAQGLFSITNAIFFLSVAAVFLFLTARRIESRRWN